jgi:hypothetical protein
MNLSHLRKQAKNLKQIYPELVAARGNTMSLAQAQEAIARIHGYPTWSAAVAKSEAAEARPASAAASRDIGAQIRAGYTFDVSEPVELGVALDDNGEPTRYEIGREALLTFRDRSAEAEVRHEEDALDDLADRLGGITGDFNDYTARGLANLLRASREAVTRCPLYVDGWNRVAGALLTQRKFKEALDVAEPIATALLHLLPTEGVVQVSYGQLENRPFFRIVYCYLLLLHEAERHDDADDLAERMHGLWPNDNMGFRFLLTQGARDSA